MLSDCRTGKAGWLILGFNVDMDTDINIDGWEEEKGDKRI